MIYWTSAVVRVLAMTAVGCVYQDHCSVSTKGGALFSRVLWLSKRAGQRGGSQGSGLGRAWGVGGGGGHYDIPI